jgi:GT2 family glycosyltransferase
MPERTPELSILLVNWNTRDMTLECLASVVAETRQTDYEIIVVDTGSTDGSAEAIAQAFPQVRLIDSGENLGFARATNLQAQEARGDKLLLLNTDTVVLNGAVDALMEFSRREPQARIWGGRTLYADGSLNPTSCWGRLSGWSCLTQALGLSAMFPESRLLNPRAYPGWLRDSEREVDIVTGCLFLIERSFWNELGGFDPRFFMFGEEAELCARAQAAGAHPMITPHATIIHYDGASNRDPLQKAIFQLQATLRVVDLHMRGTERSVARAATIGGVALRKAVFRIAARVAPARWRNRAREWAGIWARRAEWRDGPLTRL